MFASYNFNECVLHENYNLPFNLNWGFLVWGLTCKLLLAEQDV